MKDRVVQSKEKFYWADCGITGGWGVLASIVLLLSAGCFGTTSEGDADKIPIPQEISFVPDDPGHGSDECVYTEEGCPPIEIDMCRLTRGGANMFLAVLTEYEVVPDPGCEDRLYRSPHGIATFQIIDHIAGEPLGEVVEVVDLGRLRANPPVGAELLVYTVPFEDKYLLSPSPRDVQLDEEIELWEEANSGDFEIIYDVPTDYVDFASEASYHWNNYENACPDEERFEPHADKEALLEWIYERPSYCNDNSSDEEVNTEDGADSGSGANEESVEDDSELQEGG